MKQYAWIPEFRISETEQNESTRKIDALNANKWSQFRLDCDHFHFSFKPQTSSSLSSVLWDTGGAIRARKKKCIKRMENDDNEGIEKVESIALIYNHFTIRLCRL